MANGKPGAPTKWKPEYNTMLVEFFSRAPYDERMRENPKTGGVFYERVANDLPFFEEFARKIEVSYMTLTEWTQPDNAEKYPGFSDAYSTAKGLQQQFLVTNGLHGHYATAFAIFTAKNLIGWRDEQHLTNTTTIKAEHDGGFAEALLASVTARKEGSAAQDDSGTP